MQITINNEQVTILGNPYLATNSDSEVPYYEARLSNGQTGQFPVTLPMDWTWLWVEGDEYKVEGVEL